MQTLSCAAAAARGDDGRVRDECAMSIQDTNDQQFHENLEALGRHCWPARLSAGAVARCSEILEQKKESFMARAYKVVRKPVFLSTVGIAAVVALLVGFFGIPTGSSERKDRKSGV